VFGRLEHPNNFKRTSIGQSAFDLRLPRFPSSPVELLRLLLLRDLGEGLDVLGELVELRSASVVEEISSNSVVENVCIFLRQRINRSWQLIFI
jgi:hypothetical protein